MSNNYKIKYLVGLVLALSLVAAGCNLEQPTQQQQASVFDLISKCNSEAKDYFIKNWTSNNSNTTYTTITDNYINHYNQNDNKCYVLVSYDFQTVFPTTKTSSVTMTYSLKDANNSKNNDPQELAGVQILVYPPQEWPNTPTLVVGSCKVFGQECSSIDHFLELVRPYMNN